MISIYKQIFFSARFFIVASMIIVMFALSFILPWLFPIAESLLALLGSLTVADGLLLMNKKQQLQVERTVPAVMSLGDENKILLKIRNSATLNITLTIYDDLPYQLQNRDFKIEATLRSKEERTFEYIVTPSTRGEYIFGNVNAFITSPIGLINQKQVIDRKCSVHVYPSIIQMKRFELKVRSFSLVSEGIKKQRRIGHSYEFEQIKEYVVGDDSRSINWKASGRRTNLMVNQYEDERAQQVYSIIDKSRVMRLPFNNLTLLDHAINTTLVMSNIILQKHDKAGLITFSDKIGSIIPAEKSSQQLKKIMEALYNEKENFLDAEFELLYHLVRNIIKNRSMVLLYTNFESVHALERVLPILRQINKFHLLVVIFFDNEEVVELSKRKADRLFDIYVQTMAKKYQNEKNQITSMLSNHGILCIKSIPSELSINTINKYLELKSRGMI
jgi:uncharacterized protein (DUF58 family)